MSARIERLTAEDIRTALAAQQVIVTLLPEENHVVAVLGPLDMAAMAEAINHRQRWWWPAE